MDIMYLRQPVARLPHAGFFLQLYVVFDNDVVSSQLKDDKRGICIYASVNH